MIVEFPSIEILSARNPDGTIAEGRRDIVIALIPERNQRQSAPRLNRMCVRAKFARRSTVFAVRYKFEDGQKGGSGIFLADDEGGLPDVTQWMRPAALSID